MNSDDVVHLAREEARAASHRQLQRALPTADAHVINRARREYIETQRGISARVVEESLKENSMSKDQSNHNADDQEQEQHPADLYPFPAHWPVTGPFANNTDHQE